MGGVPSNENRNRRPGRPSPGRWYAKVAREAPATWLRVALFADTVVTEKPAQRRRVCYAVRQNRLGASFSLHAAAHSAESTSACSNTVCVAVSCLSGG